MNKKALFLIGLRILFGPCFLLGMDSFLGSIKECSVAQLIDVTTKNIESFEQRTRELLSLREERTLEIKKRERGLKVLVKKIQFVTNRLVDAEEKRRSLRDCMKSEEELEEKRGVRLVSSEGSSQQLGKLEEFLKEHLKLTLELAEEVSSISCSSCSCKKNQATALLAAVCDFYGISVPPETESSFTPEKIKQKFKKKRKKKRKKKKSKSGKK